MVRKSVAALTATSQRPSSLRMRQAMEIGMMNIQCPVWLLVGEHDKTGKVMAYNKMCHKKEGFPLYIIEGAAHNANDDQPQRVNELLNAFLQ